MKCHCEFCVLHRRYRRTIKNGSHKQKNLLILELMDLYCRVSEDLNYEHAIADGTWLTAVEILEKRLKNATSMRDQQEMLRKLEQ